MIIQFVRSVSLTRNTLIIKGESLEYLKVVFLQVMSRSKTFSIVTFSVVIVVMGEWIRIIILTTLIRPNKKLKFVLLVLIIWKSLN